jgi:ribose transport system permease protein
MIKSSFKHHLKTSIPAFIILALMITYTSIVSPDFRKVNNIGNVLVQVTPLAIAAIGQTIVLLSGNIDFSVGSVISFSSVILALISKMGFTGSGIVGIGLAILAGILCGTINGMGVVLLKIPPMIMSFSLMMIIKGISVTLMPGSGGSTPKALAKLFTANYGIFSVMMLMMVLLYVVMIFVTSMTPFGRKLYAVGNSHQHAIESGIEAGKIKIQAYIISGFFAAVVGILLCFRMYSGNSNVGDPYSMDTVAAVILGGASLAGGYGSLLGSFAGAGVISLIKNMLNMMDIPTSFQYIIKGVILALALLFFQLRGKHK